MGSVASPAISEDPKEFVSLCRTGRLYDVEKWIGACKPLEVPAAKNRKTKALLQIAVETGFHSMVELIAKHETSQSSKNAALADSVSRRRLDFVELLVENGAGIPIATQPSGLPPAQSQPKMLTNLTRDFILQFDNVGKLSAALTAPQLKMGFEIDKLCLNVDVARARLFARSEVLPKRNAVWRGATLR